MKLRELKEESVGDAVKRWKVTELSDAQIIEWCEQHASKFLNNRHPIYRGLATYGTSAGKVNSQGALNTLSLKRESASSNGYYNWWISNDEMWEEFPDRSKSIICSTNYDTAERYGEPHLIIPADNCKIGICPNDDIWSSFKIPGYGDNIHGFMLDLSSAFVGGPAKNWQELKTRCMRMTLEDVKETGASIDFESIIEDWEEGEFANLYDYLQETLDPYDHGFSATVARSFKQTGDHEVWVSGDIMQVEIQAMSDELRNFFEENNLL